MQKVLLILPGALQAQTLTQVLEQAGAYETRAVRMPEEFADATVSFTPDLVILDEQLPAYDLQAWTRVIAGLSPDTRFLDLSRYSAAFRKRELSVHGYLREPFDHKAFLDEVQRVLAADPSTLSEVG